MLFWTPLQKTRIDNTADTLTNKLVEISAKYFVSDLPRYPNRDPASGKIISRTPFNLSCREYLQL